MSQVFEDIEKGFLKGVADQIEDAGSETVKMVDLETIAAELHTS